MSCGTLRKSRLFVAPSWTGTIERNETSPGVGLEIHTISGSVKSCYNKPRFRLLFPLDWFPTVKDLAEAPEEKLLKAWEGLGYYSRVRNMQKAAQQIMDDFDGQFPDTYENIAKLKGIGPYTAGAISSIAFGLPEPAVDGNVMRVMARLFEVNYDIGDA